MNLAGPEMEMPHLIGLHRIDRNLTDMYQKSMKHDGLLIFLFIMCSIEFSCAAGKWMIDSNLTANRFQNIFFPHRYTYFPQGDVFPNDVMFAPKTYYATVKDSTDFCYDAKQALNIAQPDIWNNTYLINPCQKYFCASTPANMMPTNSTTAHIDNILNLYNNSHVLHAMAHNWCIKCDGSLGERFDLFVSNSSNICPYFSKTLCDNSSCAPAHTCVYFTTRTSLCYGPDFHYQTYGGFLDFFVRVRVLGIPYIFFVINFILFWINILFTAVPEMASLRRRFKEPSLTTLDKFKAIFGLRNQSMGLEIIMNLVYIVGATIDILNFLDITAATTLTSVIQLIHFAIIIYIWSLLIILWMHIYNQTDSQNRSLSTGLNVAWAIVTFLGTVLAAIALTLLITLASLKQVQQILVVKICLMTFILLCLVLVVIVGIGLFIMSTMILIKMERPHDARQFSFYFFRRKLGRTIVIFLLLIPPLMVIATTAAITYVWMDVMTYYYFFVVQHPANCFLACCFSILTCYTLIHEENFKILYGCQKNE
jgi:hypothetical protein